MTIQMLDLSALKILVVDDNQNMVSIIKYSLRAIGVRNITSAPDGERGYSLYKISNPDIIMTNWMMDNVNGLEMTKRIRTNPESKNKQIPIIMLSAYTEKDRVKMARDAGITEFLAKPFSPKSIYLRLAEAVLRPRQFVQTETFFGPDRRRLDDNKYAIQYRRKTDEKIAKPKQDA